jgi:hypothetical protein
VNLLLASAVSPTRFRAFGIERIPQITLPDFVASRGYSIRSLQVASASSGTMQTRCRLPTEGAYLINIHNLS